MAAHARAAPGVPATHPYWHLVGLDLHEPVDALLSVVDRVVERCPQPAMLDYVRLNRKH